MPKQGQEEQTTSQLDSKAQAAIVPTQNLRHDYAYYKQIFAESPMPFAYVDLDLLDQNAHQIVDRVQGKNVRIASKSVRSVAILRHLLSAHTCFQGIMCFTAREALYLAQQGFTDLLMGYPIWQTSDITAIAQAATQGNPITLMVDSIEHIKHIETIAQQYGARIPLCLDIDMSMDIPGLHFGVWRSSLRTPEQVRPIVEHIIASSSVQLDGIMGYEAQIAGIGDNYKGKALKNTIVQALKRRSVPELAARRTQVVKLIESYGITLRIVNGGGTGSIATTRQEEAVTEITVGSGFYSPTLFDNYRDFRYQPAAGYAIEIIRQPQPTLYTCQGGGYIASGAVGLDKQPQPYLPEGASLTPLEGAGEVQTPVRYTGPIHLAPGNPIFMRHAKAGELCERFTHLHLVSQGKIVDTVTTYRGDGQCFL